MAKVTNTGAGALKLVKPDAIVVTLFTGDETDDIPKGDSYVLDDVIRDTTSIAQDDNSTSDIERETSDTPILSVVTSGKYQLAAEVADTQKDLLIALAGTAQLAALKIGQSGSQKTIKTPYYLDENYTMPTGS